ncbi:hypothetical protein ES703_36965 [subsurface metagenome]
MASGGSEACYVNAEILAGVGVISIPPFTHPSTTGTGPGYLSAIAQARQLVEIGSVAIG